MSKKYTFKDCVKYAEKHNMSFSLRTFYSQYTNVRHYVLISDAIDGHISAACFDFEWYYFGHYYKYSFNGNDGRTWYLKKNKELARRIASAMSNDSKIFDIYANCYDTWFGVE